MSPTNAKRATQRSIAERAGVAQATVALILGDHPQGQRCAAETRKRVLQAARDLNYRPNQAARQLRGKRTHLLGVVICGRPLPVLTDLLWDLEEEASARGYRMMVAQVRGGVEHILDAVDDLVSRGVDCVMFHGSMAGLASENKKLPMLRHAVWLGGMVNEAYPYVQVDLADGVSQAVDHLIVTGRNRIGLILMNSTHFTMVRRREGYEAAMARHGRPVDERLIWVSPEEVNSPSGPEVIEHAIDSLVVRQRADAIVAVNDAWAVPLMRALKHRGLRVPHDVAVVGYDNEPISLASTPQLTTVDQQNRQVARAALDLMLAGFDRSSSCEAVVIKPRLVVREST